MKDTSYIKIHKIQAILGTPLPAPQVYREASDSSKKTVKNWGGRGGGGGESTRGKRKQRVNRMGRMIPSDGTKGLGVTWEGCKLQQKKGHKAAGGKEA